MDAMEESSEKKPNYDNLPLEERLSHSSYDARKSGVEQLTQIFSNEDDPTSSVFSKHQESIVKLVGDKNVLVVEKTLEALKLFIEKYKNANKTAKEFIPTIIDKCLTQKLKKLSTDVLLLFIEIDTPDYTLNELIKGFSHKVPKTKQFCVEIVREIYKTFGIPTCTVKECIPQLIKLFDDKAGTIRQEANLLCGELFRWIRNGLKSHFSDLRTAQLKELEVIFAKIEQEDKPVPTKHLRSYVPKLEKMSTHSEEDVKEEIVEIDLPTFDILSTLKSDWFEKLNSGVDHTYKGPEDQKPKPIKVRTDCLAELNKKLAQHDRYSVGDYYNLITVVLKMVGEPQAFVSQAAIESLQYLVKGLRNAFTPYVAQTILPIMTKFKEKRQATTTHVHVMLEEIDTHCKPFTEFWSDIENCIKIKVPQTKENILIFLEKAIAKKKGAQITKVFKPMLAICNELMIDADGTVREASVKCFARLMSIFERECKGVFDKVESTKQKKILDLISNFKLEKVEKVEKVEKKVVVQESGKKRVAIEMNESTSPVKNVPKKTKVVHVPKSSPKGKKKEENISTLPLVAQESVESRFDEFVPQNILSLMNDKKWEERRRGYDDMMQFLSPCDDVTCEVIIKRLSINPGFKESNMNILVKMAELIKKTISVTNKPGGYVVVIVIEFVLKQIGSPRLTQLCKECLNLLAESISPLFVYGQVMKQLPEVKAPNNVGEILVWVGELITEHGVFGQSSLVDGLKVYVDNTNTKIKKSCLVALATMKKFVGESLIESFSDVKPALLTVIKEEFAKVSNESFVSKRMSDVVVEEKKESIPVVVKKVVPMEKQVEKVVRPVQVFEDKKVEPTLTYSNQKTKREQSTVVWSMEKEYRSDLFDVLATEMKGNVSSFVCAQLLSNHENQQIAACKSIMEAMSDKRCFFDNLDLVLKWSCLFLNQCGYKLTLSIMDLLAATIGLCKQDSYQLTTFEATILIPTLVESLGHMYSNISTTAKELLVKCQDLYLVSKYLIFLEKGLKGRNLVTKMVTLELVGNLIKTKGITVCGIELLSTVMSCIDENESIRTVALPIVTLVLSLFEGDANLLFVNLNCKKTIQERIHTFRTNSVKSEPVVAVPQLDIALDENSIIRELRSIDTQKIDPKNVDKVTEVFKTLAGILERRDIGDVIIHLKEIVTRLSIHLDESFQAFEPHFRLCKYVSHCLRLIFENNQIVELISTEEMERLLDFIILIVMDQNVIKIAEGTELLKAVNTILVRMIQNGSRTCIFSALIHLLSKATQQEKSNKYFEIIVQCLLKIAKEIPTTANRIDFDILMRELHEYLQAFPPQHFKGKTDLPFRAIRSVLGEVVGFKGASIRTHLSLIATHKNPLIVNFMEVMLKNPTTSTNTTTTIKEVKKVHVPDAQEELESILTVIADKNSTSSGIYKLYKYINEHPHVDWSANMAKDETLEMICKQLENMKKHEEIMSGDLKPIVSVSASPSINARREERRKSVMKAPIGTLPRTQDLTTVRSRLMALNEEKENQI